MKKKRILYLMHVPWGCIMQRTQFVAEGLSKEYDITVVSKKEYVHQVNNKTNIAQKILFRFPYERVKIIRKINLLLYRIQLNRFLDLYDIIWLTHPSLISMIPSKYVSLKSVIYDCMDDMLEFPNTDIEKQKIRQEERFVYEKAAIVFCSAEYLKEKLYNRYGKREIFVINNALKSITLDIKNNDSFPIEIVQKYKKDIFKIVYIGTISSWFDLNLVELVLNRIGNAEIFLYGPIETSNITLPNSNKIHYEGLIEHKYINSLMSYADVLIMPFVVNELIRSVNPVKLYEYIYSGKPCLAPRYGESEKFEEYVYLYDDEEECINILKKIQSQELFSKKNEAACIEYAKENTWDNRTKEMLKVMKELL